MLLKKKIFKCTLNNYIHPSLKKRHEIKEDSGCGDSTVSVDVSFGFGSVPEPFTWLNFYC